MADLQSTSTTLLRDIANDPQHVRWGEFVARYRPAMEAFMRGRFPSLDADDVIQETLVAVWAALPSYRYAPDEKGHFHNYLIGILRNKALRQLHKEQRQAKIAEMVGRDDPIAPVSVGSCVPRDLTGTVPTAPQSVNQSADEQSWRETLVEIALQQLMNDDSIQSRTRQVFLRVAVNGENAAALVADMLVSGESGYMGSEPADELGNMWGAYDCGLASSYFVLAAKNRGWDTPIMGIRDTAKVKSILGIPAGETLMSIIAVGNAAVKPIKVPPQTRRRGLENDLMTCWCMERF